MDALCYLGFNCLDTGLDLFEKVVNGTFKLLADLLGSNGLHAFK